MLAAVSGCTTKATRLAIDNYRKSEAFKQNAFDNSLRIAKEQMFLSTSLYVQANPDKAKQAILALAIGKDQLEECRVQYERARFLSMIGVGQYLYDQQGWLNTLLESEVYTIKRGTSAAEEADKAMGVTSVMDLIPKISLTPPAAPVTPADQAQVDKLKAAIEFFNR